MQCNAIITFTFILFIKSRWEYVLSLQNYESSFLQKTLYQKVWGWLSVFKEWIWDIIILDLPQVLIISQNIGGQLQIHTDWPSPLRWVMTIIYREQNIPTRLDSYLICTPNRLQIMATLYSTKSQTQIITGTRGSFSSSGRLSPFLTRERSSWTTWPAGTSTPTPWSTSAPWWRRWWCRSWRMRQT